MIEIVFNEITGFFEIRVEESSFVSSVFSHIVDTIKSYYCSYGDKFWYTFSPSIILAVERDLSNFAQVKFNQDDKDLAQELLFPVDPTFKKSKLLLNQDFFNKHPPLIGKHPFEKYQSEAVSALTSSNRKIASIAMGGGKTYIMSGVIANLLHNNKIDKIMWVCRPEGLISTKLKILYFLGDYYKDEDIAIIDSTNKNLEDFFDKKIILLTYNTFRIITQYYYVKKNKYTKNKKATPKKPTIDFSKWGDPSKMMQILDEGQAIKNDSLQTNAFLIHQNYFNFRYILSGTIGFELEDYFFTSKYLIPNSLPLYSEWKKLMFKKVAKHKYEVNTQIAPLFKQKVVDKLQIVYDESCLDVPEFISNEVYINMSSKMKKLYRTFINDILDQLNEEEDLPEKLALLRRQFSYYSLFTSDPILVKDNFDFDWKFEENPKIEIVDSLLHKYIKEEQEKTILWSTHPTIINELKRVFASYNPYVIHGDEKTSLKKSQRFDEVQDFRTNKTRNLLITSYVLNSSIDLYEASRTIYWDLIVDNDKFEQSKRRHHRLGQKKTTKNNFLLFDDSADVYIWENIIKPKNNVRDALTSETELTVDMCKKIFLSKAKFRGG